MLLVGHKNLNSGAWFILSLDHIFVAFCRLYTNKKELIVKAGHVRKIPPPPPNTHTPNYNKYNEYITPLAQI